VISEAARTTPVVFAGRPGAGSVLSGTYGFTGSEQDLLRRGALAAGWLDARKARLLLWALLAAGTPRELLGAEFALRDGSTSRPADRPDRT
jgi:L-asparaginase